MKKCSPLYLLFAVATYLLTEVDTTPLPPRISVDGDPNENPRPFQETEMSAYLTNKRRKRGIPYFNTEEEWEKAKPCGCDPCECEVIRNANEARMIRKQQRKIVAQMKMNRLKKKVHRAVCPQCTLAHEREMGHKHCNKPHMDITVVVPGVNPYATAELQVPIPEREYPMPPLPPSPPPYTQVPVLQTGSEQFSEPAYDEPVRPGLQYEPMVLKPLTGSEQQYGAMGSDAQQDPMVPEPGPQFEPMVNRPEAESSVSGFGHAVPWIRSSDALAVDEPEPAEKKLPPEDLEKDSKRGEEKRTRLLQLFPEAALSTPEAPMDSEDAWPFQNATYAEASMHEFRPILTTTEAPVDSGEATPFYPNFTKSSYKASQASHDETSLKAPPIRKTLWQAAYRYLADRSPKLVKSNCSTALCTELCLGPECLEKEVRPKRDTSFDMPMASAWLTGLVSAIIGV